MVKYTYDAWGNHKVLNPDETENTSTLFIGNINPIRYRSYYFDIETGLYFLQTRYYDPQIGRFINIDDISYLEPESINGMNLYAYCGNNPVMRVDPDGNAWWHWLLAIGAVIVVAAATVLTCGAAGIAIGGAGLAGAVIHGAAVGALIGAGIGAVGGAVAGGIYSAVTGADFWTSVGIGAAAGFGIGAIVGAIVGGTVGGIKCNPTVKVDIRKFTEYALDPSKSKGKSKIFNDLGYSKSNAKELVKIYKSQGKKNFLTHSYELSKTTKYGQHITMGINVNGTELKTAWMLLKNGIKLITPFTGFM